MDQLHTPSDEQWQQEQQQQEQEYRKNEPFLSARDTYIQLTQSTRPRQLCTAEWWNGTQQRDPAVVSEHQYLS